MRVLHAYKIFRPDIDGGIGSTIAAVLGSDNQGISSSVLAARGKVGFGQSYEFDLNQVRAVGSLGNLFGMPIAPGFPMAMALRSRKVDVLVLHHPFPLNDIGVLGVPDRVGLIVHWHSEIYGRRLLARGLEPFIRNTLARADRIIVSNHAILANSSLLHAHQAKCEIVPFGVDPKKWSLNDEAEKSRAAALRERYPRLIVALGRLVPYKGFDVLLRALAQVDGHLIVNGLGPEQKSLERLAIRLGVSERVTFAGYSSHDEIKIRFSAARVFAFPSVDDSETFGIAQLEAMAVGLPIVNTRLNTAVPLVARDGMEAITVPPGDPQALAAALTRLLDNEALAKGLGEAALARVCEEFDETRFVARIHAIYRNVNEMARLRQD
jgi:glycosyltransferase involved in cell wall biosynthesis